MGYMRKSDILGVKEVGDYLGVSSSAVVNIRKRHEDFPLPVIDLKSGPIFNKPEVELWAVNNNYPLSRNIRNTDEMEKYKSIAVVGRHSVVKSCVVSMFVADDECFLLRRVFSQVGNNSTLNNMRIVVSSNINETYAKFHTHNKEEFIYSMLDEKNLNAFIIEVNCYIEEKHKRSKDILCEEYIEIFVPPSELALSIITSAKLAYIIIHNTLDIVEDYSKESIVESDLVILILGGAEDTVREDFKKFIEETRPLVAAGDICFIYDMETPCDENDEFIDMQKNAEYAMQIYEKDFKPLSTSIIDSLIDIFKPSNYVIGAPSMKKHQINKAEKWFRERLKNTVIKSFNGEGLDCLVDNLEKQICTVVSTKNINDYYYDIKDAINGVLRDFGVFKCVSKKESDDFFEKFKTQKHDRLASRDYYRIAIIASYERQQMLVQLYNHFKKYSIEDITDTLIQDVIKLFYKLITARIKSDIGIGNGFYPWNDYPPVTMHVSEYILSKEIYLATNKDTVNIKEIYVPTLRKNGITSSSWCCVWVDESKKYLLEIIVKSGILNLHSSNMNELVRNRYIGGLFKKGEYEAWEKLIELFGFKTDGVCFTTV